MSDSGIDLPILPNATDSARLRRFIYAILIAAASAVVAGQISAARPLLSANDRSRWCTVWSLVERNTFRIDETQDDGFDREHRKFWHWKTIDRVNLDGHYYSTKPPLLSSLVACIYWGAKQAFGWTLTDNTEDVTRLVLYLVNFVPFVISLVLIAAIVERYATNDAGRIFVLAAAGLGTFLTTFQVALNNHTVAAAAVLFAIYPAMRIICDGKRGPLYFAISGFSAGFACANELPAALFGALLFLWLVFKTPKGTLLYFVPAAVVPLGALLYVNYLAVGMWQPSYALYGSEAYTKNVDGTSAYWQNPQGIDKGGDSPLVYLLHCTVGHHGIFSLTPVFLLSLGGWMQLYRGKNSALKPMLWMGLGLTVAVLAFYLTRTENYNYGGVTSGLRWAFWLIPFWLIAILPVFEHWGDCWRFRSLAIVFLLVSVFSAAHPVGNPFQHPWLYKVMNRWGWIDYDTPTPRK